MLVIAVVAPSDQLAGLSPHLHVLCMPLASDEGRTPCWWGAVRLVNSMHHELMSLTISTGVQQAAQYHATRAKTAWASCSSDFSQGCIQMCCAGHASLDSNHKQELFVQASDEMLVFLQVESVLCRPPRLPV